MTKVKLLGAIKRVVGKAEVTVKAGTVKEVIDILDKGEGKVKKHLFGKDGRLSPDCIIMVNGTSSPDILGRKLKDEDTLSIFPVVGGG